MNRYEVIVRTILEQPVVVVAETEAEALAVAEEDHGGWSTGFWALVEKEAISAIKLEEDSP